MKNCSICGSNENGFYKDKSKPSGFRNECKECSKKKDKEKRKKNQNKYKQRSKDRYVANRQKIIERVKKYYNESGKEKERERVRNRAKEIISMLGGECKKCGRKDNLSLDHINNDGAKDRSKGSKDSLIRKLLKDPEKRKQFQVLCFNCNQKKQIEQVRTSIDSYTLTGKKKTCPTCNKDIDIIYFHNDISYETGKYYECIMCTSIRRKEIKTRVIDLLGGKCKTCGENDVDVLSIDHIKPIGKRIVHGYTFYNRILSGSYNKEKLQVLCFNCNQTKGPKLRNRIVRNDDEYLLPLPESIEESKIEIVEYDFTSLNVEVISSRMASEFLDKYHYDKYGRHAKRCYAAKLGEEIIAVVKLCSVTRQGTPNSINLKSDQVLELDRLCVSPSRRKKNLISWLLSKVMKFIIKDFPNIIAIVSFADTEQGHDGTVYKAANWIESGKTAPSYYYINNDGKKIKKKTFFDWIKNNGMKGEKTEFEVANELDFKKIKTAPKIRFIYYLRSIQNQES